MIRLKRNTGGNDSIPSIGGNSHETAIIAIFRSIHISRERNQQKPQAVRREAFHEAFLSSFSQIHRHHTTIR